jgi:hypothetical protein
MLDFSKPENTPLFLKDEDSNDDIFCDAQKAQCLNCEQLKQYAYSFPLEWNADLFSLCEENADCGNCTKIDHGECSCFPHKLNQMGSDVRYAPRIAAMKKNADVWNEVPVSKNNSKKSIWHFHPLEFAKHIEAMKLSPSEVNPIKGGKDAAGYYLTGDYASLYDADDDGNNDPHSGIDMVSRSREIVASMKGTVIFAGVHPNGIERATGTLIIIRYEHGEYGTYGHLDKDSFLVKAGDAVNAGTALGKYYDGKMGASSGGHLHYGRYRLDDSKREDKFANVNDFVRQFDVTGYFYNQTTIPDDKKLKDGFYSVEPKFER